MKTRTLYKRRYVVGVESVRYAHVIWNRHNPDNVIAKGDNCVIHHIDGNSLNDTIQNLIKLTREQHARLHNTGKIMSQEFRDKLRTANIGKILSQETKLKIGSKSKNRKHSIESRFKRKRIGENNHFFGKSHTDETIKRMRQIKLGKKQSQETKDKIRQTMLLKRVAL